MFLKRQQPIPEISLCIPVHNTERFLERCLESVSSQNFKQVEVVLINDLSTGKDEKGRNCRKIVKDFKKKTKIPVTYIEHSSYVPLLETRRELVEFARGKYVLMVDSDDFLAENALKNLYDSAVKTDADITCGKDLVYRIKDSQIELSDKGYAVHKEAVLHGRDILDSWLVEKTSSAFLWAKLIKRELYLKAFNSIPYMDCSFSVDTPIYFFLAWHAESYCTINDTVYYYLYNEGITGGKKVTDLETWRRQCTVSSNYTLLLTLDCELTEAEKASLRKMSRQFLYNAIIRLRKLVLPELYDDAYRILCEYWSESYVKTIEGIIDKK